MEDNEILDLYFARSEQAIAQTERKYGPYCFHIANHILSDPSDAEESVNDTYYAAWKLIPPRRPQRFAVFLGKLTRNLSIDRWRKQTAQKRGGKEMILALEELGECLDTQGMEAEITTRELTRVLNGFLASLSETERNVFLCRYWYMDTIETIAKITGFSRSKVTSMLHRSRGKLRKKLAEEGYAV